MALTGPDALRGVKFAADAKGCLKVWEWPARERHNSDRYVVTVDIGGRSAGADWSVIAVMDRGEADGSGPMRIAARGAAYRPRSSRVEGAAIAAYYNEALLVVEATLSRQRVCAGCRSLVEPSPAVSAPYKSRYSSPEHTPPQPQSRNRRS